MKVWVVIVDISYDYDNTIHVELFHDREKAKKYMLEQFEYEINDTEYDTIERDEHILSAYDEGYFVQNHCEIRILDKEIKE